MLQEITPAADTAAQVTYPALAQVRDVHQVEVHRKDALVLRQHVRERLPLLPERVLDIRGERRGLALDGPSSGGQPSFQVGRILAGVQDDDDVVDDRVALA